MADYDGYGGGGGGFGDDNNFAGDGGFGTFNTGLSQDGGFNNSQTSPSSVRKKDENTLIPCTIKQIKSAEDKDGKFRIDGRELSQVTIVGCVLGIESTNIHVKYMMDDGTGPLDVTRYADNDDGSEEKHEKVQEGQYARITGSLKSISGRSSLVAYNVKPIENFNEVTFHFLECIHTHLINTQGAIPQGAPSNGAQNNFNQSDQTMTNAQNAPMDTGTRNFKTIQEEILSAFKENDNDDQGCNVEVIAQLLPHIPRSDLEKEISNLSDEGYLYSTIDEQHLKCTDE